MGRINEIFDTDSDTEFSDLDDFDAETEEIESPGPIKEIVLDDDYELVDESIDDIDFSSISGDFKSSLKQLDKKLSKPRIKAVKRQSAKPLTKGFGVKDMTEVNINGRKRGAIDRIIVPRERQLVVQGVDKFILDDGMDAESYKNIGYYKGEKLKELILIFNNNSALDFTLELFNPSMMLDYLYSTGQNLNNKVQVAAGTGASYSDVVYHMIANPTLIPNAKLIVSGPQAQAQQNVSMAFKNKNIAGEQVVNPLNVPQNLDTMQFQSSVIAFDIMKQLDRPFIPDSMDVINYTVLAGNTVTLCFYYKQRKLKKFFWKEAKDKRTYM